MANTIPVQNQPICTMAFGENLKRLRQDQGFTQGELAKKAGLRIASISKLEKNQGNPKLSTIYQLIDALECSPDALLIDLSGVGIDPSGDDLNGALKTMLERATHLPKREKEIIIDVIDTYCITHGFNEVVDQGWRKFAIISKETKKQKVSDEMNKETN